MDWAILVNLGVAIHPKLKIPAYINRRHIRVNIDYHYIISIMAEWIYSSMQSESESTAIAFIHYWTVEHWLMVTFVVLFKWALVLTS